VVTPSRMPISHIVRISVTLAVSRKSCIVRPSRGISPY
jgi:hypothetical protein